MDIQWDLCSRVTAIEGNFPVLPALLAKGDIPIREAVTDTRCQQTPATLSDISFFFFLPPTSPSSNLLCLVSPHLEVGSAGRSRAKLRLVGRIFPYSLAWVGEDGVARGCAFQPAPAIAMPEQGCWVQAPPLLDTHGGDWVQSKTLGDEGAARGMGGPNISASPFSFTRKGTKMTSSVLAYWQLQGLCRDMHEIMLMCPFWYKELVFCVVLRGVLPLVGFWSFLGILEDESIGFANTSSEVGGGDKRKATRSGITRVCGTAGIKHAKCLGQASGGKKNNNSQLFPIHLHQQGSNCHREEVRFMGNEMHCLQDKGEGEGTHPILPPNQTPSFSAGTTRCLETLGGIQWPEDLSHVSPWCPAVV